MKILLIYFVNACYAVCLTVNNSFMFHLFLFFLDLIMFYQNVISLPVKQQTSLRWCICPPQSTASSHLFLSAVAKSQNPIISWLVDWYFFFFFDNPLHKVQNNMEEKLRKWMFLMHFENTAAGFMCCFLSSWLNHFEWWIRRSPPLRGLLKSEELFCFEQERS